MSCAISIVLGGGLLGAELAPDPRLATLPIASFVVGTALFMTVLARLQHRFGRRAVFISGACYGASIALLLAYFVTQNNFWAICVAALLFGAIVSVAQQYRFAAMESVETTDAAKAIARVLLGGIAAAFLGPEIFLAGKDWLPVSYAGSFVLLAMLLLGVAALLYFFVNPTAHMQTPHSAALGRSWREIFMQPVFAAAVFAGVISYAVMSLIMTATPLSMHVLDGHHLLETKRVIQMHVAAMFLPSLVSGSLIARFGVVRMLVAGLLVYALCIAIGMSGQGLHHYRAALILLGVGWNLLFVGGTALLPQSYQPAERFRVQAANDFMVFGVQALASLSAGWILYQWGWRIMLAVCVPLLMVQLFFIWRWQVSVSRG